LGLDAEHRQLVDPGDRRTTVFVTAQLLPRGL
jgi:hypothetical protein